VPSESAGVEKNPTPEFGVELPNPKPPEFEAGVPKSPPPEFELGALKAPKENTEEESGVVPKKPPPEFEPVVLTPKENPLEASKENPGAEFPDKLIPEKTSPSAASSSSASVTGQFFASSNSFSYLARISASSKAEAGERAGTEVKVNSGS
jgi:hypothetical protein